MEIIYEIRVYIQNNNRIPKDKTLIIVAIIMGVVSLAAIIGFIGQGNV